MRDRSHAVFAVVTPSTVTSGAGAVSRPIAASSAMRSSSGAEAAARADSAAETERRPDAEVGDEGWADSEAEDSGSMVPRAVKEAEEGSAVVGASTRRRRRA